MKRYARCLKKVPGGLSANTIGRLKQQWEEERKQWSQRDSGLKNYVYIWADGIYFNVRGDDQRSCILVIIGATDKGKKGNYSPLP